MLLSTSAWAREDYAEAESRRTYRSYSDEEAFTITTGALLKNPAVATLLKNSENWGWNQVKSVGLNEEYVRVTATVAAPLVYKKISTQGIHMHWEPIKDVRIRPDFEYYFDSQHTSANITIVWRGP